MARLGITYEDVAQAAESILQQGKNPTMESVRHVLGETGSFTTINKHLHVWRGQRLVAAAQEKPEQLIETDTVSRAVNQVWEQLSQQAQQQLEKIKQESEEKIITALEEKALAQQERAEAIQALEKATIKINHLETNLTLAKKELIEMRSQCAVAQEKAANKEEAFNKMELLTQAQVKEIKLAHADTLQSLNQQVETLKESYEKTIQEWKDLFEKQRVDYMMKAEELKLAKEKTEKALVKAEIELQQQSLRFKEIEGQVRGLSADLAIAQQQQQEMEKQAAVFKAEIVLKENNLAFLQKTVDSLLSINKGKTKLKNKVIS